MERTRQELLEAFRAHLRGDVSQLRTLFPALHPADLAEILTELEEAEQVGVVSTLEDEDAALVLQELEPDAQLAILRRMDPARAAHIFSEMSRDDLADLLGDVAPEEAVDILEMMPEQEAADVQGLLEYLEDTAGGLMTTEFIALQQDITAAEAIETLRRLAPDAETIYYLYVVDQGNHLVGVLSLRDLIIAGPGVPLGEIMNRNVITVPANTDQEEVARVVAKYDLLAIPVVDDRRRLLGIVTVDDVVDVIEEEATEDIMRMTASSIAEDTERGAWSRAVKRLPWLLILLAGELITANVIKGFSATLEALTLLAFFIPVIAGTSGNAATQSLAVVVRGIGTGGVDPRRVWQVVGREARVGIFVGTVTGFVLGVATFLWHGDANLGFALGFALAVSMTVAATLGGFFPVLVERLGFDPAVASGPFITTLTDAISMFIYFGIATMLFGYFLPPL